jgi:purine-binding chemotaxis protein CheW
MPLLTGAASGTGAPVQSRQYLTFQLGEGVYGVPILDVQEIKGQPMITPIPNAPPHLPGVMNVRGMIAPVVDLRVKFSLPDSGYDRFTVVILVSVAGKLVGMVVDAVSDVVDLAEAEIQAVPDFGAQVDVRFVSGLARVGERLLVLLDVGKVLGDDVGISEGLPVAGSPP